MPGEERNDDYRRLISAWMDGQSGRGRRASRHVTPARRAPVACRFHCSAEPCRSRAFRASRSVDASSSSCSDLCSRSASSSVGMLDSLATSAPAVR